MTAPMKFIIVIASLLIMSGCTMSTVPYQPDFNLVNDLKDSEIQSVSVGDFSSSEKSVDSVSVRGSSMVSTYEGSFSEYLEEALKEQLQQSSLLNDDSTVVITGTLLKNAFDASGFSIGESDLTANFVVTRDEQEVYNKDHSIHHEWESSFVGAVAIPNAQQNYPIAVQKLITAFLSDPGFIVAVKN